MRPAVATTDRRDVFGVRDERLAVRGERLCDALGAGREVRTTLELPPRGVRVARALLARTHALVLLERPREPSARGERLAHPLLEIEQVRDVVGKASKSVALLIQRGADKIFIPVRIG
mgnify:CR=1 FL=1